MRQISLMHTDRVGTPRGGRSGQPPSRPRLPCKRPELRVPRHRKAGRHLSVPRCRFSARRVRVRHRRAGWPDATTKPCSLLRRGARDRRRCKCANNGTINAVLGHDPVTIATAIFSSTLLPPSLKSEVPRISSTARRCDRTKLLRAASPFAVTPRVTAGCRIEFDQVHDPRPIAPPVL